MIFNLLGVVISDLVFVLFCLNVFLKGDFVGMVYGYELYGLVVCFVCINYGYYCVMVIF